MRCWRQQRGDHLLVHQPPGSQDQGPVADLLDFGNDVGRKDHGASGPLGFEHQLGHVRAHGRIEVRRGLVEDHQRRIDRQGHGQRQFLPHSGRHGRHGARQLQAKSLRGQFDRPRAAAVASHGSKEVDHVASPHRAKQPRLAGQIRNAAMHLAGPAIAVEPVDRRLAGRGSQEPHHQPQQRGLAGPVGPQQSDDFALLDVKRKRVERGERAVPLGERAGFDEVRQRDHRSERAADEPAAFIVSRRQGSLASDDRAKSTPREPPRLSKHAHSGARSIDTRPAHLKDGLRKVYLDVRQFVIRKGIVRKHNQSNGASPHHRPHEWQLPGGPGGYDLAEQGATLVKRLDQSLPSVYLVTSPGNSSSDTDYR